MIKNVGVHLRIASLAAIPAILISALAGAYLITSGAQQFKSSFIGHGRAIARLLATPVEHAERVNRGDTTLPLTQSLLRMGEIQAMILTDRQGKILETAGEPSDQLLRAAQAAGGNVMIGDRGIAIFSIPFQHGVTARPPAIGKSAAQGWVEISTAACKRRKFDFIRNGIFSLLAGVILSLFFGVWFSRRFILPPNSGEKSRRGRFWNNATAAAHPPPPPQRAQTSDESVRLVQSGFLASLRHELRTPLNGLIGFIELLGQTALSPPQRRHLGVIRSSAQILHTLVGDMADFPLRNAGSPPIVYLPMNLSQVMEETAALHRPEAERKGLTLTLRCDPAFPSQVIGAPVRIAQILSNLIGNAVKFTTRGSVDVSAVLAGQSGAHLQIVITVSDTGPGMDAATRDQLFSPSAALATATTARAENREKLGLMISKTLTARMGGTIGADSTLGQGCRVYFTLPLRPIPALPQPNTDIPADHPHPIASGEEPHALIVDDSPINRLLAKTLLAELHIPCDEAESGEQALAACQWRRYALILMDIQLPQADGVTTAARIRAAQTDGPSAAIIAVTAENGGQTRTHYLAAGFDDILIKPLNRHAFYAVIRRRLRNAPAAAEPSYDAGAAIASGITVKMRKMLMEELPSQQAALWTALHEENHERLHRLAHRLHGAAHYCGAPVLAQAAKTLASATRLHAEPSRLAALVELLDNAAEKLLASPQEALDDDWDRR
ncbi:MAG TPA: hypothetical protein DEP05_09930 [Betaproteobacteria bacterium]|nr:hypothetical protein [Betaproteobacteria bacterium]